MAKAILTIASKNYGSWSLRGWLLCKLAGLDFDEQHADSDDPSTRAELLLLSPSFLVPCLTHDGIKIWDTLAIAEYLDELKPEAGLIPEGRAERARCRSISGEMHSGFTNLRSALPMNLQGALSGLQDLGRRAGRHRPHHRDLARMPASIAGPILFGANPAWPTPCLRRCARASSPMTLSSTGVRGLLQDHHGDAGHAGMDRGGARPSPTNWKSSTWSFNRACGARRLLLNGPSWCGCARFSHPSTR